MRDLREAKAEGYIKLEIRMSKRGQEMNYTFYKESGDLRYIPMLPSETEDVSQMKTIML